MHRTLSQGVDKYRRRLGISPRRDRVWAGPHLAKWQIACCHFLCCHRDPRSGTAVTVGCQAWGDIRGAERGSRRTGSVSHGDSSEPGKGQQLCLLRKQTSVVTHTDLRVTPEVSTLCTIPCSVCICPAFVHVFGAGHPGCILALEAGARYSNDTKKHKRGHQLHL